MTYLLSMLNLPAWVDPQLLRWPVTGAYLALMALIGVYGLHRYWLVYLYGRHRSVRPRPGRRYEQLPRVTVQVPMFNEGAVVHRIIDAACAIDYPADRLQVQVVDDSTDHSADLAQKRVDYWAQRGVDIQYLHREDRTGFKAGALQNAMQTATGELIAIFDADFIPPRSFLKRTVHYFTDPALGMVQTRWAHINRNDSLLTRGQAIFLDGHFVIEHTARNRSGAWINFNGTAGLWRREAIESAGGWQHDTLTEDVDLSYRAQLAGWQFLFLPWVQCPAELPPEINAFKSQQHRWTKGSIQTAIKLLPTVLRADVPWKVKLEAFFHLTSPMVYLYITLFAALFYPAIALNIEPFGRGAWYGLAAGLSLFGLGTISATIFYIASQRAQKRSALGTIVQVPMLMAIGIGIALNNAIACIEALVGHESPFIRTPKYNTPAPGSFAPGITPGVAPGVADGVADELPGVTGQAGDRVEPAPSGKNRGIARVIPIPSMKRSVCLLELGMGVYMLACAWMSLNVGRTVISLPFLLLFAAGYLYVGGTSLWVHLRGHLENRRPMPQVA
jgi:cellulose synthase/poly-beta-1,6-N-acetylglucosamine synthase-like glycosyltransferase